MTEQPTDQDLVRDHPFTPARFSDAWPGICGYIGPGWQFPCGFSWSEHADPAPKEKTTA